MTNHPTPWVAVIATELRQLFPKIAITMENGSIENETPYILYPVYNEITLDGGFTRHQLYWLQSWVDYWDGRPIK